MAPSQHQVREPAPWNRGKLVGPTPPLKLQEVWAIRIRHDPSTRSTRSCRCARSLGDAGFAQPVENPVEIFGTCVPEFLARVSNRVIGAE